MISALGMASRRQETRDRSVISARHDSGPGSYCSFVDFTSVFALLNIYSKFRFSSVRAVPCGLIFACPSTLVTKTAHIYQ